ncbi:MAG: hypothetical protein ACI87E_002748 [Mariniblastus sp.]|jgi:hypothetical protein
MEAVFQIANCKAAVSDDRRTDLDRGVADETDYAESVLRLKRRVTGDSN